MLKVEKGDTLGKLLDRAAMQYPKNEAIVLGDQRITYDTYLHKVNCMGHALLKLGVKKGEKIAIFMANIPEWLYAHFAAVKLGAPVVPINTRMKVHELEYILKGSDATTLFMMDYFLQNDYVSMVYEILPELKKCKPNELKSEKLPLLKRVIILGERSYDGMFDFEKAFEMGKDYAGSTEYKKAQLEVKPEDVYQISFTSGTTGFPKGVVATHEQFVRMVQAYSLRTRMSNKSRILVVSPFATGMGNVAGFMPAAVNGGCILPMLQFNPGEALRLIDEEKTTFFCGSPTMYIMMMEHPDFPRRNTRSIKCSVVGGADVSPQLVRNLIDKMGIKDVINAYGMTENTYNTSMTQPGDSVEVIANTNGKIFYDGCEVKILDPATGAEVRLGTQGEICTKGWFVMKEYYKMPEETQKAFDNNGWFHTGDLGFMNEKGYLTVTGRLKDMFITGGYNVYPAEIENFIYTHPKVAMTAVIGVLDKKMGEVGMAFIKLKDGQNATAEDIIGFAKDKIASYKVPKYIKFIDDFPVTPTGKIQKFVLRDLVADEFGQGK